MRAVEQNDTNVLGGCDWATLGARILQAAALASAVHMAERATLARTPALEPATLNTPRQNPLGVR
jgi:hypothetical protein